ncbi:MAG: hypothetical protein WBA28_02015 [Microbacteriaceae bacterium]
MKSIVAKPAVIVAALLLTFGLSACGEQPVAGQGAQTDSPSTSAPGDGENGRVFDSTNDAVIQAVNTAVNPDSASWDGKTLVVHFDTPKDALKIINCTALNTIIAKDETAKITFNDGGELDCEERR